MALCTCNFRNLDHHHCAALQKWTSQHILFSRFDWSFMEMLIVKVHHGGLLVFILSIDFVVSQTRKTVGAWITLFGNRSNRRVSGTSRVMGVTGSGKVRWSMMGTPLETCNTLSLAVALLHQQLNNCLVQRHSGEIIPKIPSHSTQSCAMCNWILTKPTKMPLASTWHHTATCPQPNASVQRASNVLSVWHEEESLKDKGQAMERVMQEWHQRTNHSVEDAFCGCSIRSHQK